MGKCDKWAILRILEVIFVGACLVFKRVTDDEAFSLFLYLQKLSREWSLLNNVTWSKVGSSVADATYGGYFVITCALLIGKLAGDLPTKKRVAEYVLLGVGAILFIVLGSLEFAAIDSLPHNLVDNAAILGTLSVIIGALFLLDLGAPKAKDPRPIQSKKEVQVVTTPAQRRNGDNGDQGHRQGRSITQQIYDIEREIDESERDTFDEVDESRQKSKKETKNNGVKNGGPKSHNHRDVGGPSGTESAVREFSVQPTRSYIHLDPTSKGYKQMRDEAESQAASHIPRPKFGIYGKDAMTFEEESETDDTATLPPKIELHNPVWSQLRKGREQHYGVLGSFR